MSVLWKVLVCVSLGIALVGAGLGMVVFLGLDAEVMQSGPEMTIDLTQVMLQYQDQLRGIEFQQITVRQVIQDALWFRINDPAVDVETRAECFLLVGLFHEGRATEITPAQYDILTAAITEVWGPAIIQRFTEMVGGAQ